LIYNVFEYFRTCIPNLRKIIVWGKIQKPMKSRNARKREPFN
jgi:hypothetical protein